MVITYLCYYFAYHLLFVIPFSPVIFGAFYLSERCENLALLEYALKAVMFIALSLYLFVVPLLTHEAARAKVYDDASFWGAISLAMAQVRLHLAFLPIVGGHFAPKGNQASEYDQTHHRHDGDTKRGTSGPRWAEHWTTKKSARFLVATAMVAWVLFGYWLGCESSTIQHTMHLAVWLTSGCGLLLVSLILLCFRGLRLFAVASILILVADPLVTISFRRHRYHSDILKLETIFEQIASRGPPFPESVQRASFDAPDTLQWYYQRNSTQSFSIVYLVSSDGWAMEYPGTTWQWIGYWPKGYTPNNPPEGTR